MASIKQTRRDCLCVCAAAWRRIDFAACVSHNVVYLGNYAHLLASWFSHSALLNKAEKNTHTITIFVYFWASWRPRKISQSCRILNRTRIPPALLTGMHKYEFQSAWADNTLVRLTLREAAKTRQLNENSDFTGSRETEKQKAHWHGFLNLASRCRCECARIPSKY